MNKKVIEKFNEIYNQTYENTMKYIMLHSENLDDIRDLIQDTYLEVYKNICKNKHIQYNKAYVIGITKNIMKKYYKNKSIHNNIVLYQDEEIVNENIIKEDIDMELEFITKENVEKIWKYIENKDIKIQKIFYSYYHLDMKLIDIAKDMQLNESTVKSYLYRTIKELRKIFEKESDINV